MIPESVDQIVEFERARLSAAARLKLDEAEALTRFQSGPWPFFQERVRLLDPLANRGSQIADYPHFPYCEALVNEIHSSKQLIIWKSRRMIVSWTVLAYFVWLAGHFPNQRLFVLSRVEGDSPGEGARELIVRADWLVRNLRAGPKVRCEFSKLHLDFPDTGSTITGMGGSEPNKMRQMSANGVFCDEFAFWPLPEASYGALRPTLEGRGKVIITSSTASGYFQQLVYDDSGSWMEPVLTTTKRRMNTLHAVKYLDGMEAWTNRGNGFRLVGLDYWADPRKQRGSLWEKQEKAGLPDRLWRQEMLRQFNVHAGRPVFLHEWDAKTMVVAPLESSDDYNFRPFVVSLDFGYNRPAAVVMTFLGARRLRVLRAHLGHQIHFTPFMGQLLHLLREWFPDRDSADFLWACDAAGKQQGRDALPEVEILRKQFGIRARFRYAKVPPTIDRLRDYMTDSRDGMPSFQVERHESTQIVIDALNGGYRYPEPVSGQPEPNLPFDDGFYIHVMDATRYGPLNYGSAHVQNRPDLTALSQRDIVPVRYYTP